MAPKILDAFGMTPQLGVLQRKWFLGLLPGSGSGVNWSNTAEALSFISLISCVVDYLIKL